MMNDTEILHFLNDLEIIHEFLTELATADYIESVRENIDNERYKKTEIAFRDFELKLFEIINLSRTIDRHLYETINKLVEESDLSNLISKIHIDLKAMLQKGKPSKLERILFSSRFQYSTDLPFQLSSIDESIVPIKRLIPLTRKTYEIYQNRLSIDDEIFKPSNLNKEHILIFIENAYIEIQESAQVNPSQKSQFLNYFDSVKNELSKDTPSWKKIIGALVIAATLLSGIADAPNAYKNITSALTYILGVSIENHIKPHLPAPDKSDDIPNDFDVEKI